MMTDYIPSDGEEDWTNLPPLLINDIFKWLPLQSRLQAASTCSDWRQILWSPDLWREQTYTLNSKKSLRHLRFLCEKGCVRFAKSIEFIWPAESLCPRPDWLTLYPQIVEQIHMALGQLTEARCIEKFVLKVHNPTMRTENLDRMVKQNEAEKLAGIRSYVQIILRNNKLKYLSFGCSSNQYWPVSVLEHLNDQSKEKIEDLHIATENKTLPSVESRQVEGETALLDQLTTGIGIDALQNLQRLSIDWHCITPAFLEAFNGRKNHRPLKKLNIFVHNHQCSDSSLCHPEPNAWNEFARQNKTCLIAVIFKHNIDSVCNQLQHVAPVHTLKFCDCLNVCDVTYGKLILWFKDTLQAHLMVNNTYSLTELENGHVLWMHMRRCSLLKYISVIGFYIYEDVLKLIIEYFAATLEVFHVPKNLIVTAAEATNLMVPISGSKVTALCRTVQDLLRRPWSPLRRHPLGTNFFSDGCDDEFYMNPAPPDMLYSRDG